MKALMGGRSGGILRNQKWMSGLFRLIIIMLGMMITPVSTGALGRGIGGCLTRRIGRLDGSLSDLPGIRKPELFLMRRGGSYNQGYGGGRGFDYNDNPYDGYDDEDEYDDRYGYQAPPPPRQRSSKRGSSQPQRSGSTSQFSSVINQPVPPQLRRFGWTLLAVGAAVTALGCSLFFEKNLIRLGNICLISGLPLAFGPARVLRALLAKQKLRATACFVVGVLLVLRGNSFFGLLLELFGFLNIFANFFPLALVMLKNLPFVGDLLKRPEPRDDRRGYYRDQDW